MLGVDCVCGNESRGGVAQSGECFGEGSDPEGTGKALCNRKVGIRSPSACGVITELSQGNENGKENVFVGWGCR